MIRKTLGLTDSAVRRINQRVRVGRVVVEDYENNYDKDWVYHTSPVEITEIYENPLFGDVLFFANEPYWMGPKAYVYRLDLPEDEIIDVSKFNWLDGNERKLLEGIIGEIQELTGATEDEAWDLLSGGEPNYSPEDDAHSLNGELVDISWNADVSWVLQGLQGKAAKLLGYQAAQGEDEQGIVYMVPMTGRISELELVEVPD